jgi:hypothetical protein
MCNKEEKLPETLTTPTEEKYELYLYMTGNKPLEIGYMLFLGSVVKRNSVVGVLYQQGIFELIRDEINEYTKDINYSSDLVINTRFINPTNFTR